MLPSLEVEVTFRNRSAPWLGDVVLMQGGVAPSSRANINRYRSHLVIDAVTEGDEGTYTVKNPNKPEDVRRMVLVVRGTDGSQNAFSFHRIKLFSKCTISWTYVLSGDVHTSAASAQLVCLVVY